MRSVHVLALLVACRALTAHPLPRPEPSYELLWLGPGPGYVEVPHAAELNPAAAITIEMWLFLRTDPGSGCVTLLGKDAASSYWMGLCDRRLSSRVSGPTSTRESATAVAVGLWTHVAVVTDGQVRLHYVDGRLDAAFVETGSLAASEQPLRIGHDVSLEASLDALLDEARLWRVARSQAEIEATRGEALSYAAYLYAEDGLVANWSFDRGGEDSAGEHDGVLIGDSSILFIDPACLASETTLCVGGGRRFGVEARWQKPTGESGFATAVPLGDDSGALWFFRPDNLELIVKVLDGCSINGHYWVFAAGLTNLGVELTVHDGLSGEERQWSSPVGAPFESIQDIEAFDLCP